MASNGVSAALDESLPAAEALEPWCGLIEASVDLKDNSNGKYVLNRKWWRVLLVVGHGGNERG